jgi:hypothetical protein
VQDATYNALPDTLYSEAGELIEGCKLHRQSTEEWKGMAAVMDGNHRADIMYRQSVACPAGLVVLLHSSTTAAERELLLRDHQQREGLGTVGDLSIRCSLLCWLLTPLPLLPASARCLCCLLLWVPSI